MNELFWEIAITWLPEPTVFVFGLENLLIRHFRWIMELGKSENLKNKYIQIRWHQSDGQKKPIDDS